MIIFFAGTESLTRIKQLDQYGVENILTSYFHLRKNDDLSRYARFHSFLDSGGFTARKSGVDIDVVDYGKFILKNPMFKQYANLDVKDTEVTLRNQKTLESMGLKPIPVFHMDEWQQKKYDLFDHYCKNYTYIAVGGVAEGVFTRELLHRFLDYVFYRTRDKIKVHGFGMTAINLLKRYPFYSADSTSWIAGGRYNQVMTQKGTRMITSPHYRGLSGLDKDNKNIQAVLKMQKFVTEMWEARGIVWKN